MAKHKRRVLIGTGIEEILDNHFKEIVSAIPEMFDLVERHTMRIARTEGPARDLLVDQLREDLLALLRTHFTVVLSDERSLSQIA